MAFLFIKDILTYIKDILKRPKVSFVINLICIIIFFVNIGLIISNIEKNLQSNYIHIFSIIIIFSGSLLFFYKNNEIVYTILQPLFKFISKIFAWFKKKGILLFNAIIKIKDIIKNLISTGFIKLKSVLSNIIRNPIIRTIFGFIGIIIMGAVGVGLLPLFIIFCILCFLYINYNDKYLLLSIFLISFLILPTIYNLIYNYFTKATLLEESMYLNNKKKINMMKYNDIDNPNYHYGVSFWFWINPQSPNTNSSYLKYTNIFSYNTHSIVYNSKLNTLKILYKNNNKTETIYKNDDILYQKWNNIFMNIDGGNLDIYLNSTLVSSKPNIITNKIYDNIIIGEDDGIHGGLNHLQYFDKNLNNNEIRLNYYNYKFFNN
jgi:hypothetical protein